MLPVKFGNVAELATYSDLGQLFDQQTTHAEKHYATSDVVISGTPPAWSTVAAALPAWRAPRLDPRGDTRPRAERRAIAVAHGSGQRGELLRAPESKPLPTPTHDQNQALASTQCLCPAAVRASTRRCVALTRLQPGPPFEMGLAGAGIAGPGVRVVAARSCPYSTVSLLYAAVRLAFPFAFAGAFVGFSRVGRRFSAAPQTVSMMRRVTT